MSKLNRLILIGFVIIEIWPLFDESGRAVQSSTVNSSVTVHNVKNKFVQTESIRIEPNSRKNSRLQDDDEKENESEYEDNEGIDESPNDSADEEGADQEEGDDDGSDSGGDDSGDSDDGADGDSGGDDSGGDDEPADDEPGADGPSEPPSDGGGGDEPAVPPGDPGGPAPEPPSPGSPGGDANCPNPDTIFSTANAWRVRLLSQICQLSNYLLSSFHFKHKYIIKKLQHLISLLSYNQSNMNLDEMVRFLSNIQSTYNQLLTGYLGVFYILKKCQYKQMCFDCAIITGQLQKLMIETNYTLGSHVHLSNRTMVYLRNKLSTTKHNHTKNPELKRTKKKKQIQIVHQPVSQPVNLTQMLIINKKLHKEFKKHFKRLDVKSKKRN